MERTVRSRQDLLYFQERAEQEIRRAQAADHPDAVKAHYELAGYYLDLVHNRAEVADAVVEIRPAGDRTVGRELTRDYSTSTRS